MNRPPSEFSRISHEDLHGFVSTAAQSVGLPQEKAELLASLLAGNDLRGVFSHGTQQIATYARFMRDGKLNNKPEIDVVESSPCSLLVDGDGGVGYFPAHEGTARRIPRTGKILLRSLRAQRRGWCRHGAGGDGGGRRDPLHRGDADEGSQEPDPHRPAR